MGSSRPTRPVLIVEDDEGTRESLATVLQLLGFAVATAVNGEGALDYLRAGRTACVIVLDLQMPVMDGYTLMRILKAHDALRRIPVIAFSSDMERDMPDAVVSIRKDAADRLLGAIEAAALPD